ncbi:MAG TPA: arginine deiminase-related protein [Gemmatimonadales bacterium]|jgi:dimethylargininase
MTGRLVALVRRPTDALARCELTHLAREPLDVGLARDQHAGYVAVLRDLGVEVVELPGEPALPDAVFVEDAAVVLDEVAVLTNPGAASRRPEVPSVAAALAPFRPLRHLEPPATLDGGDVVRVDRTLFVGRSSRTNDAGTDRLAEVVAPHGYAVRPVRLGGCLHLKSACTYLGDGVVLANPAWVDVRRFEDCRVLEVTAGEPRAANTFRVGNTLVMAAGFPHTTALIEDAGFAVRTVPLTELQKAEAGGSCMSLVFPVFGFTRSSRPL